MPAPTRLAWRQGLAPLPRLTDTLVDLARARRSVPIGLLAGALVAGQAWFTPEVGAVAVAVILVATFLVLGPHAWRRLFGDARVRGALVVRLGLFAGLGVVTVAVFGWSLPVALGYGNTFLSGPGSVLVQPALFWVGAWGLGRDIELEHRATHLERVAEEAQLLALRAHLDPHFLFNTLNALAEWCRLDPALAEEGILSLSRLLRSIFEAVRPGSAKAWTVADEVGLARGLFSLHALRDPGAFEVEVALAPDVGGLPLPPLLLLPLAENAMTHGVGRGARGKVTLAVGRAGELLEVVLESPGAPGPAPSERPAQDHGHGLELTRTRLGHLGPAASLTLEGVGPAASGRTRVRVAVPIAELAGRS